MRPYFAVVAVFVVPSFLVGPFVGWPVRDALLFWVSYYLPTIVITGMAVLGAVVWVRVRGDRSLPAREGYRVAWLRLRVGPFSPSRWRSYAALALSYPAVIGCYTAWRLWLNRHVPFVWDEAFAAWSVALHGGRYPWEYTRVLTASVAGLVATETLYGAGWAFVTHAVLTWQAFAAPSRERTRALVAFALAWPVIGNGLAGLFMSAGPCFYGRVVGGPDPFAPLMTALDGASVMARPGQEALWTWYHAGAGFPSIGITALPSMHVTMATLACVVLWRGGHRVGGAVFVAFNFVASVALGWHYALDGYAAMLAAAGVWWLAGRVTR